MEKDFFDMYERNEGLAVDVGHNSVADWVLSIYDRKGEKLSGRSEPIIHVQNCDRAKVFAEAYVKLANYLSDARGGY